MKRQGDAHLSPGELDAVMRLGSGPGAAGTPEDDVSEVQQHLAACDTCQSTLAGQVENRLGRLKTGARAERGSECPQDSEWPLVAAGLKEGSQAEALLLHASTCDHCGPLLRQSITDFEEDLTDEEEAMLARLASSRPEWQERLAAKLSRPRRTWSILTGLRENLLPAFAFPRWAYAAGVALLAAVSFWGVSYIRQTPIDALLATAYTEQRTLELRIPKAAHGPVRLIRGSSDRSRLDRPPALLEGEARIARELAKHPASPALLQAMGRADLLDWNYDAAIGSLTRAVAVQPDSPSLMIDLASAYFERAEAGNLTADYSAAVELLSKALKASPHDPVALFNRAIVYERMHLYDKAIEDWQHYLRVDPNSTWTSEAKKRLADVEQSKNTTK